jgi:hypothetical protein
VVSFAINNIAFGTATEPVPDGDGQIKVRELKLNVPALEAVDIPTPISRQTGPFDLVAAETRVRWKGCWFYSWESMSIGDGVITITDAVIQFESHGVITPPGGPNRGRVA